MKSSINYHINSEIELNQIKAKYKGSNMIPSVIAVAIKEYFKNTDPDIGNVEFAYCVINNIQPKPKCPICNTPYKFISFKKGYSNICKSDNSECIAKRKSIAKDNYVKAIKAKYGVENISQLASIKEKKANTLLKHYGVRSPLQSEYIKAKASNTIKERFGVDWIFQNKDKLNQSIESTNLNTYNALIAKEKKSTVKIQLNDPSEFKGTNKDIIYKWKCEECGTIFESSYVNSRIPICRKCHPLSSGEDELYAFVRYLNPNLTIKRHTKSIIKPNELDIYIPELKLAIEFNGVYWHSTKHISDIKYHLNKTKACEEKGIWLIHIWEWDWIKDKDKVKIFLKDLIVNHKLDLDISKPIARSLIANLPERLVKYGYTVKSIDESLNSTLIDGNTMQQFEKQNNNNSLLEIFDCGTITLNKIN